VNRSMACNSVHREKNLLFQFMIFTQIFLLLILAVICCNDHHVGAIWKSYLEWNEVSQMVL
jgi:hypothetical protein